MKILNKYTENQWVIIMLDQLKLYNKKDPDKKLLVSSPTYEKTRVVGRDYFYFCNFDETDFLWKWK